MPDRIAEGAMRRFLLNACSEVERAQIEAVLDEDEQFVAELAALEDELTLAYVRGELTGHERHQFELATAASADLRSRVDETRQIVQAAEAVRALAPVQATPAKAATPFRWQYQMRFAAAAAIILLVGASVFVVRRRDGITPDASVPIEAPSASAIQTFDLPPGNPRDASEVSPTALQLRSTTKIVVLTLAIPIPGLRAMEATLKPIDGAPLRMSSRVEEQRTTNGFDIRLQVPAGELGPADYLLTVTAELPEGRRDVVATRLFSVVR